MAATATDSPLIEHARRELALIGEDEWITNGIVKIVSAFAEMGHSGSSAEAVTGYLERLLRFKALTPLTDNPAEWHYHGPEMGGGPLWQNIRDSRAMSTDGGKTYTLVDERPAEGRKPTVHTSKPKAVEG
jgi:hypothetical protein